MLALKVFRDKAKGVADLVNWAALIDDGIVQGKNGALLAGYFYRGQDIASSTEAERNHLTHRVNTALARLGSGWVTWQDAVRMPSGDYPAPEANAFPDPITRLIDAERRAQFTAEGAHFESEYALVLQYTPPERRKSRVADWIYDDDPAAMKSPADRTLAAFRKTLEDIEDALAGAIKLRRMRSYVTTDRQGREHLQDELVNYLNLCLTGHAIGINIPPAMYLDRILGGQELWPGDTPRIGGNYVACVAIMGFPHESYPNILEVLEHLPIAYRWSTRMIYLDQHEAVGELKSYRRKWKQRQRGFISQVFKVQGGMVNEDAVLMTNQVDAAITDANSALVTFGYYTPVITLMGPDREALTEYGRTIVREIQREGFECRLESVNTLEAWLGSLPGHAEANIRRPMVNTLNLADLLPLSSVWAGRDENPCPLYPAGSPALLHAATAGATPFRLNLHVGDVGHTLVFGPTGAGKSTKLAVILAQFRRYRGATICAFDKGRSIYALTKAAGGRHYDIGAEGERQGFAPLASLDTAADMTWAEEWVATCFQLQTQRPPSPREREAIHKAIKLLRDDKGPHERSLTDFILTVQDEDVRSALRHYTIGGSLGHLLDASEDGLTDAPFMVFEIEELMGMGDVNAIPVLLYLFRRFEKSLHGQPALLSLDEAWIMLGHPVFREKIREWLKVMRKNNCAVVMATQSLSDAVKSGIFDVLVENCPTKILLPNEEADKGGTDAHAGPRDLYTLMGLNEVQIDILKNAQKKRHYYYLSTEGRRLYDLGLGPIALAFCAVSDKDSIARIKELEGLHGEAWPYAWLTEKGVRYDHRTA